MVMLVVVSPKGSFSGYLSCKAMESKSFQSLGKARSGLSLSRDSRPRLPASGRRAQASINATAFYVGGRMRDRE